MLVTFPKPFAVLTMQQLATVDYSVATRVSEDVATIVKWAYENDQWWLATSSLSVLQFFDDFGSLLIKCVVYIIAHAQ